MWDFAGHQLIQVALSFNSQQSCHLGLRPLSFNTGCIHLTHSEDHQSFWSFSVAYVLPQYQPRVPYCKKVLAACELCDAEHDESFFFSVTGSLPLRFLCWFIVLRWWQFPSCTLIINGFAHIKYIQQAASINNVHVVSRTHTNYTQRNFAFLWRINCQIHTHMQRHRKAMKMNWSPFLPVIS